MTNKRRQRNTLLPADDPCPWRRPPPMLRAGPKMTWEARPGMAAAGGVANLRAVLATPAVVRLWLAGVGAGVMRWLEILAYSLWVFAETGSPLMVTLTAFARMLPLLLLGAIAATIADHFDRRRLMLAMYLIMSLCAAGLAVTAAMGGLNVPIVTAYALLTGIFWALEMPVRRTMLAEAAGMERVNASMGLEMTSNQLMRLVGPAAGGLLMATTGITGVFAIGAALYASGAMLLIGLAADETERHPAGSAVLAELREGFAFVRRERLVAGIVVSTALFNLWYLPYLSLGPLVAAETMHLGPTAIGLLIGAEGIGAIAGSLWVATMARPEWFRLCYSLGGSAIAAGVLVLAVVAEPVTSFIALVLGGVGIAGFSTMQMTLVLAATPRAMRVRVMGVVIVAIGSAPFGFLLGGALAEWLGPRLALTLTSGGGLLAMLACMAIWPELRRVEPVVTREG